MVVEARPDQPVEITATRYNPQFGDCTVVQMTWSKTGFVPNVGRFVKRVREETGQLRKDRPGAVLVDVSSWNDFRGDGYYLGEVRRALAAKRGLGAFVGAFDWQPDCFEAQDRSPLYQDDVWTETEPGRHLLGIWNAV